VKLIEKEQGQTRVHARALELLGTMSETQVLHRLAAEGWMIEPETLRKWRVQAGIPAFERKVSDARLQICVEAYRTHGGVKTAARALSMDPKTLRRRLADAGVTVGDDA
jgi:transposase-like protein